MNAENLPQPTGATLRWFERSAVRRYDSDATDWLENPENSDGTTLSFGAQYGYDDDDQTPFVRIRIKLRFDDAAVSALLDTGVEFSFAVSSALERVHVLQFVTERGIDYLLGIQRGVLADMTREVGLPAALIPPGTPDGLIEDLDNQLKLVDATIE